MTETTNLKSLAQRFLARDGTRDVDRDDRLRAARSPVAVVSPSPAIEPPAEAAQPGTLKHDGSVTVVRAYRVYSRLLDEEVWLAEDESHAQELERELAMENDRRIVFTVAEVEVMRGMLVAEMRSLARPKRWFPGARIEAATRMPNQRREPTL